MCNLNQEHSWINLKLFWLTQLSCFKTLCHVFFYYYFVLFNFFDVLRDPTCLLDYLSAGCLPVSPIHRINYIQVICWSSSELFPRSVSSNICKSHASHRTIPGEFYTTSNWALKRSRTVMKAQKARKVATQIEGGIAKVHNYQHN